MKAVLSESLESMSKLRSYDEEFSLVLQVGTRSSDKCPADRYTAKSKSRAHTSKSANILLASGGKTEFPKALKGRGVQLC